jgi:glycosyltransferase involved in cell wall biosynthesis
LQSLSEPRPGKARALNRALRVARGDVFAFTDDDCRLHPQHVNDLLRYDAGDTGLVLRGGRTALGDPTDLPYIINLKPDVRRWSLAANSARHTNIAGEIHGCNTSAFLTRILALARASDRAKIPTTFFEPISAARYLSTCRI